ncbi:MAG: hypothetical protein QUV05_15560 [Phycisphaerae bacterium]|jgi:hypothetical protein|nr:hypothetical protein [Phycisphaerae bacterium]
MNPMKRLGLAALLVLGVMPLGSTTASAKATKPAKPAESAEPVGIWLSGVGDEPGAWAAGSFTVHKVKRTVHVGWPASWVVWSYTGRLTLACEGLRPGATYLTPAGSFTADATGAGSVTGNATLSVQKTVVNGWEDWRPAIIDVVRLAPDGSRTTVLSGEFWGTR